MTYTQETIKAVAQVVANIDAGHVGATVYENDIANTIAILEALESTAEQKELRADGERLCYLASNRTYWITAQSNPHGQLIFDASPEIENLREAVDKARGE